MTRAATDMDAIARALAADLQEIRDACPESAGDALCSVETFCAVALRVMRHSNPSKVRDAARTVEIKARMDGTPVETRSTT